MFDPPAAPAGAEPDTDPVQRAIDEALARGQDPFAAGIAARGEERRLALGVDASTGRDHSAVTLVRQGADGTRTVLAVATVPPQTGLRSTTDWRELVAHPPDASLLQRRHLQLWQYRLHEGSVVVLRPVQGSRQFVVATVDKHVPMKGDLDNVPASSATVYWYTPVGVVNASVRIANGLALCYGDPSMLTEAVLASEMSDRLWSYTREAPDKPFKTLPGPPRSVDEQWTETGVVTGKKQQRGWDF